MPQASFKDKRYEDELQQPGEQPPVADPNAMPGGDPNEPRKFTFQDREIDEHPELVNLAKFMDPKDLSLLGQRCFEEYREDEESRSDWLKMQTEWVNLYYGKLKPLDPPWEHASDDHLPILAEGCTQFHARAYKAFFANFNFVSALPVGNIRQEDKDRAERVGKYMSWQLGVRDKTYKRRKDRLLKALPLHGSYFTKTFRDNLNQKIVVENVSPLDLVANYTSIGTDVEDLERKTQIIPLAGRQGRYLASDATKQYFLRAPTEYTGVDHTNQARAALKKIEGTQEPPSWLGGRPGRVLEQHRYLDLDGDGIEEPYIVWVDAMTQDVLRVAIRWSFDAWRRSNYKMPLEYYTHYVYIENPDGFYGFGQGHLVGDMNIACDKLLRQIVNAGTLQNSRPGFATQNAGIKSGKIEVQPGRVKKLNGTGNIRDMVMFLDHPGPSEALWRILQLLTGRADRMNMVTDALTGQPEQVWQTGAMSQLIEQGLMVFSSVQVRIHAALEQELSKVYRLNGIYLDDEQYFIFNDGQTEEEHTVYRTDFNEDLQVRPAFDPNQLSDREKKQMAAGEYEAALKNPIIASSPEHLANATRRFFETMGARNLDEIVPGGEEVKAKAQQKQEQQSDMVKQATTAQAIEQQATLVGQQADLALDQKKAEQKDRELDQKEAALRLKADTEGKELKLEAVRTAAELETAARASLEQARPGGNA